ncbi:Sugar efflux transporter, partial [Haemophilus influenzae]
YIYRWAYFIGHCLEFLDITSRSNVYCISPFSVLVNYRFTCDAHRT